MNLIKIIGVACFNAFVGLLFVYFYGTNLLFSIVVPQVWTIAYGIKFIQSSSTTK